MAKHVYEAMFIFDSNRFGRDPGGVSGAIATMAQKFGGEILASRLWEERRLAYPINGQRKGTYWLTYLRLESKELVNLNREISLNESIMRSLVLKVDPRIVDALVSHATQSHAAPAPVAAPRREAVAAGADEAAE
ncbi:MAG: 30S ribosomal protein S6 [Planctomycetes bacterium]|nr:30S ribosomal protein S6 [Planctomycetota bacterium]